MIITNQLIHRYITIFNALLAFSVCLWGGNPVTVDCKKAIAKSDSILVKTVARGIYIYELPEMILITCITLVISAIGMIFVALTAPITLPIAIIIDGLRRIF